MNLTECKYNHCENKTPREKYCWNHRRPAVITEGLLLGKPTF